MNQRFCRLNLADSLRLTLTIDPGYITWFNDWFKKNYSSDPPFPWTRLGYTYDWGNPVSDIGLSEFVTKTGATVGVGQI